MYIYHRDGDVGVHIIWVGGDRVLVGAKGDGQECTEHASPFK